MTDEGSKPDVAEELSANDLQEVAGGVRRLPGRPHPQPTPTLLAERPAN